MISGKGETGAQSDIEIAEFDYDPRQRPQDDPQATKDNPLYANYQDDVIIRQWSGVISAEHVLRIEDPKSIIDVMLGALALVGGGRDLNGYLQEMAERDQHELRRDQAEATLGGLASALSMARSQVSGSIPSVPRRKYRIEPSFTPSVRSRWLCQSARPSVACVPLCILTG